MRGPSFYDSLEFFFLLARMRYLLNWCEIDEYNSFENLINFAELFKKIFIRLHLFSLFEWGVETKRKNDDKKYLLRFEVVGLIRCNVLAKVKSD